MVTEKKVKGNAGHHSFMKLRLIYIITPALLLVLALASGSILLWRLFSLCTLVLILAYLWTYLGTRGLGAKTKKLPEHLQAGESFDEEITLCNKSRIPQLLLEAEENSDLPSHSNRLALNLASKGSFSWQTRVYCQKRGRYRLGALKAKASDPFFLFSVRCNLGEPQSIIIYPPILEVPFHLPTPRREQIYSSSQWLMQETPPNAARIREYTPSDSLSHIHWHSTAHTGRLMVRVFEAERVSFMARSIPRYRHVTKLDYMPESIWLIPDMHRASNLSDGDTSTEDCSATIAASLAKMYIDARVPVGLIASGEQFYLFPPEMGEEHLRRILEALALMKAESEVPIHQLIMNEVGRFDAKSVITVITPSLSKQIITPLSQLSERGCIPVVVLLDPLSFGGTESLANATDSLSSSGIEVYIVSRQNEPKDTLTSRIFPFQMKSVGDKG